MTAEFSAGGAGPPATLGEMIGNSGDNESGHFFALLCPVRIGAGLVGDVGFAAAVESLSNGRDAWPSVVAAFVHALAGCRRNASRRLAEAGVGELRARQRMPNGDVTGVGSC
ncbi:hypothetical protein GCM10010464_58360 [Pseudonocardia yunnanensis]|uniref:Uncharacterized protein n=1 Tax=Pseudonocardia yunnanensis TaxID=58107 RepID=A0ABW4FA72_9PSEU